MKDAAVFTILPSVEGSVSMNNDELFSMLQVTDVCFPIRYSSEAVSWVWIGYHVSYFFLQSLIHRDVHWLLSQFTGYMCSAELKSLFTVQRITKSEWLRLEGTSGGRLGQPLCSSWTT